MADTTSSSGPYTTTLLLVLIALLVAGVFFLNMPDRRTSSEKLDDAAQNVSDGMKDAGRSLENRTPAQKTGDAIRDMGKR